MDTPHQQERTWHPTDEQQTLEWITVLAAAGTDYRLSCTDRVWTIHVPVAQADRAGAEISAYEQENRDWPAPRPPVAVPTTAPYPRNFTSLWAVLFLALVYYCYGPYDPTVPVLRAAAADADRILTGEWWRTVTAIAVHGDIVHLAGNIIAVLLLGHAVCASLGGGLGWSLLLAAGAATNYGVALLAQEQHVSIGASSVSFAALGILVMLQAVRITPSLTSLRSVWSRTWIPVAAGLAVLSLLGTAPNSDLTGHGLGFVLGTLFAVPSALFEPIRISNRIQWLLEAACLAVVLIAWYAAIQG